MNTPRILIDILLFFSIVLGNAPLVLLFGVIGSMRFFQFWEFLFGGFLFELLYGVGSWSAPVPFSMFFGSTILFALVGFFRAKIR